MSQPAKTKWLEVHDLSEAFRLADLGTKTRDDLLDKPFTFVFGSGNGKISGTIQDVVLPQDGGCLQLIISESRGPKGKIVDLFFEFGNHEKPKGCWRAYYESNQVDEGRLIIP